MQYKNLIKLNLFILNKKDSKFSVEIFFRPKTQVTRLIKITKLIFFFGPKGNKRQSHPHELNAGLYSRLRQSRVSTTGRLEPPGF